MPSEYFSQEIVSNNSKSPIWLKFIILGSPRVIRIENLSCPRASYFAQNDSKNSRYMP